jgi:hypothetical protein
MCGDLLYPITQNLISRILLLVYGGTHLLQEQWLITTLFYVIHWSLPVMTVVCLQNINRRFHHHYHEVWRVRLSNFSLTPRVELVPPSFPRASYNSPSFRFILQYPGYPVSFNSTTEDELQTTANHLIIFLWCYSITVRNYMQKYSFTINAFRVYCCAKGNIF